MKLYVPEPGHETVRAVQQVTISVLARVEVAAAIARKRRVGELRADHAAGLAAEFAADVKGTGLEAPRFMLVPVADTILAAAVRLVARHPLRAYDAVQLATALAVIEADRSTRFISFDTQLNAAAAAEGLQIL